MNTPYVFKKCSKCGEWLVACKVNFGKMKGGKYGLDSICKKCKAERNKKYRENNRDRIKQYYENNRDKIAEHQKQYYENNRDRIAGYKKKWYENNKDKMAEQHKQYQENNRDKIAEYQKQWQENNRDRIAEYQKQWQENNRDRIAEYKKKYRENNRDRIAEHQKQYYENNRDRIAEKNKQYRATPQGQVSAFNRYCRRKSREQNQGNGINKEQWLECMNFFDWKCAYSGETLKKGTRTIDHIKPLNRGGEHEIWNVVPMHGPYNSSKNDKDLLEWYKEQDFYSEERLQKIYEWQEYAYKKWGNKDKVI